MKELIDISHDNCNKLRNICGKLNNYAQAFYITGNCDMADKLDLIEKDIFKSQKAIEDIVAKTIHEGYKQSQEMSATILKTALAVTGVK